MKLRLVSQLEPPEPHAGEPAEGFRYWAFLSYSHHDKAIAKKLQKQLETYRVPRRLLGRETPHGVVPARLSPVFRDRDELHAGSDLKASVQEALSRSRWLIVVCTPDAARSPWVNREIVEFKKLHGERRVLALIAHGEPFASDKPGREAEECFPPALRHALNSEGVLEGDPLEPIAADMRKEGDGSHRAALKLLAGMLGLPFDDLVRRDLQRRVRWLTALAAASVAGLVVFGFLAVMAVQARNEAQYQRQQAEGLIEFMLGDLRKKLEPVGRLAVLDSVGEKALGYYAGQNAGKLDATALGHRSRAMHLIGEIRDLRGQPAEAQQAFEQAAQTTARLLAESPQDGQRIFDHAQSVFWVGYAAWKRADGAEAESQFQEYLNLAQRLLRIDPGNVDWRAEVAFAHINIGVVRLGTGRPNEALRSLTQSGALFEELLQKRPDLLFDLANNHGWMADAHELLGEHELALRWGKRKLALFEDAPNEQKNFAVQREILAALSANSVYELALGNVPQAEWSAKAAAAISERLVAEDPTNLRWRFDSCVVRMRLAHIGLIQNHPSEASRRLTEANACLTQYNAVGTTGLRDSLLAQAFMFFVSAQVARDADRQVLTAQMNVFLNQSIPKLQSGTLDRAKLAVGLANVSIALGELRMKADSSAARSAFLQAKVQLEPFALLGDGAILVALAKAHFYLGDVQRAEELVARISRTSYRHPMYADLVKQLQAVRGGSRFVKNPGAKQ